MEFRDLSCIAFVAITATSCSPSRNFRRHNLDESPGWAELSINQVDLDVDVGEFDDSLGLRINGGVYVADNALGRLSAEGQVGYSRHDFSAVVFTGGPVPVVVNETPTNLTFGLGLRQEVPIGDSPWIATLSAGLLYQYLYDDLLDEDGFGPYLQAGASYPLNDSTSFGPVIQWSSTDLDETVTQLSFGLALRLSL